MRSLLGRSPLSVARGSAFFLAFLIGGSASIERSMAQRGTSSAQEKKPTSNSNAAPSQAKPGKSAVPTLEEMLNKALKDNPDIRVAEAKVREAEAELNRTRLQVTQKVLTIHHSRESQKALIKVAEEDLQRVQKLEASKAVSQEDVKQAQQRLSAEKAKLAEIEAEMPYLLGQQDRLNVTSVTFSPDGKTLYSGTIDGAIKAWDAQTGKLIINAPNETDWAVPILQNPTEWFVPFMENQPKINQAQQKSSVPYNSSKTLEPGSMMEKVRKLLDTPVNVDYKEKMVHEILEDLKKQVPGLSIHDLCGLSHLGADGQDAAPVQLQLKIEGQIPLRAALQLLLDTLNDPEHAEPQKYLTFALREYGLLFAPEDRIPSGALRLRNLEPGQYQINKLEKEKAPAKDEKAPSSGEKKH